MAIGLFSDECTENIISAPLTVESFNDFLCDDLKIENRKMLWIFKFQPTEIKL